MDTTNVVHLDDHRPQKFADFDILAGLYVLREACKERAEVDLPLAVCSALDLAILALYGEFTREHERAFVVELWITARATLGEIGFKDERLRETVEAVMKATAWVADERIQRARAEGRFPF